jgi:hypothetical protein
MAKCNVSKKCKRAGWAHLGGSCGKCHVKSCDKSVTTVADTAGTALNTCTDHIGQAIEK